MKPAIRMIAIDLDGTLLDSQKRISEEDVRALQAAVAQGVEIVPVTGRNFNFALPIVQRLPFDVPVIASNGAIIRSIRGETFWRGLLPRKTAAAVLEATREFRAYTVLLYDPPGACRLWIETPATADPASGEATSSSHGVADSAWIKRNQSLVRYTPSLEQALEGDPLEVMFAGPVATLREIAARLNNGFLEAGSGNGSRGGKLSGGEFRLLRTEYLDADFTILDAIREDCSKGHALAYWSQRRGIPPAGIMAIGDNHNDLEMLEFVGLPVVMGNAEQTLKQRGWAVTRDCDSSGVAHAIQQYVL